jgi:two-component system sensor histidine kinase HydH
MITTVLVGSVALLAAGLTLLAGRLSRRTRALSAAERDTARLRQEVDRCQRLLAQTDRLSALGLLAASVAHEVRNPLVSVRTFAQLLPERLHDEEFRTSFRNLALAEIDRISLLVNDLLAFARPAAPEVHEAHEADLNDILGQICRLVDGEAKKRGLEVRTNLDADLPPVAIDEARVKQVFLNVVLNAIHACDPGGRVTLATRAVTRGDTPYFQVEVRDSGCGIPATDLGRIFDPFFTTKVGGSGLGLFITQRIVREHGGVIDVASAPGAGAIFQVNFPMTAPASGGPGAARAGADADDLHHRSLPHG